MIASHLTAQPTRLSSLLSRARDVWTNNNQPRRARPLWHDDADGHTRQIAFTFAIIALSARLIKADGQVSKQEYWAFREVFPMQADQDIKIRSLFLMAMNEKTPAEFYARQIISLFPNRSGLYGEVMDRLLKIATADAALNDAEEQYLQKLAQIFGFSRAQWRDLLSRTRTAKAVSPYEILGVSRKAPDSSVRAAYLRLIQAYHPDKVVAASPELVEMLTSKLAEINAAYDEILRARGTKRTRLAA